VFAWVGTDPNTDLFQIPLTARTGDSGNLGTDYVKVVWDANDFIWANQGLTFDATTSTFVVVTPGLYFFNFEAKVTNAYVTDNLNIYSFASPQLELSVISASGGTQSNRARILENLGITPGPGSGSLNVYEYSCNDSGFFSCAVGDRIQLIAYMGSDLETGPGTRTPAHLRNFGMRAALIHEISGTLPTYP